jgi:putative NADH-flavin reductase
LKTIALFGGSGQTGKLFLQQALAAGYTVNALVRNPAKLDNITGKINIIKGDVLNYENVLETIVNADVVISLFGQVKGSPEWVQTNGTKNIIKAMQQVGVQKIVSLSGGGLPYPSKDEPKFADKLIRTIMKIVVPKILNDAIAHHKELAASNLMWSIVRAPRLTNDAPKNNYKVGWVGVNASTKISRADLASFLLTQVGSDKFVYEMPFVSW